MYKLPCNKENIAIVKWSNNTINKFYAYQKENMEDFIATKQSWYPELTFEISFHNSKELSDNELDGIKL